METNVREEIRRMKILIMRLTAEIGGKNQKTEYIAKQLKEGTTKLSQLKEETDQLDQDYKQEKKKVIMTTLENQRLEREIEDQKKAIEQQGKEIKKRDSQLDFKDKQILVLKMLQNGTEAPQQVNNVQGVENMSGGDKVQLQIAATGLQQQAPHKVQGRQEGVQNISGQDKEVRPQIDTKCLLIDLTEEEDSELSQKQTLDQKEHRSNQDVQEAPKVSTAEIGDDDSESSLYILDDWRLSDCDFSDEECNSSLPIPPPESSADPCNNVQDNSSDVSVIIPDPEVKKSDECVKGDIQGGGGVETVECNAFEDKFPQIAPPESLVDLRNDMPNKCSDLSSALPVPEVECAKGDIQCNEGLETVECNAFDDMFRSCSDFSFVLPDPEVKKGDVEGSGGVECNAFQDMFPPLVPLESLVDPCTDMQHSCLDFSFVLPPDYEMSDMDWLSTFADDSMLAGDITLGIDFSDNIMKDDSAAVFQNSSSSCSGGMTMPLSADTIVPVLYGASVNDEQFSISDLLQILATSRKSCVKKPSPKSYISLESVYLVEIPSTQKKSK